jgi:hypothetical protein
LVPENLKKILITTTSLIKEKEEKEEREERGGIREE